MESISRITTPSECVKIEGHLLLACLSNTERRWSYLRVPLSSTVESVLQFFRMNFLGWPYLMRPAMDGDDSFFKKWEDREVKLLRVERFPLEAKFSDFVRPEKSVVAVELRMHRDSTYRLVSDSKILLPAEPAPEEAKRILDQFQEEIRRQDEESWETLGVTVFRDSSEPITEDSRHKLLDFGSRFHYCSSEYPSQPQTIRVKADATIENILHFFRRYCFHWPSGIAYRNETAFLLSSEIGAVIPSMSSDIRLLRNPDDRPDPRYLSPYSSSIEIETLFSITFEVDARINSPPGDCSIA